VEAAVDGTMIAAGGDGDLEDIGFIKIWNANTGKLVSNPGFTASALPGDGKTLSKILLSGPLSAKPVLTGAQPMLIVDVSILKCVRMYSCIIRTATYAAVYLTTRSVT
jgi:hypothetical protein